MQFSREFQPYCRRLTRGFGGALLSVINMVLNERYINAGDPPDESQFRHSDFADQTEVRRFEVWAFTIEG
jgi:hypothetical protein